MRRTSKRVQEALELLFSKKTRELVANKRRKTVLEGIEEVYQLAKRDNSQPWTPEQIVEAIHHGRK